MRQQRKEEIMAILYANTRDASEKVTASQAILNGLAKHGDRNPETGYSGRGTGKNELSGDCIRSYEQIPDRFYRGRTEKLYRSCL